MRTELHRIASAADGDRKMCNLKRYVIGLAALALGLISAPAMAQVPDPSELKCDSITGGGWLLPAEAKANFAIGGGCGRGPEPFWGHLQYVDHAPQSANIPLPPSISVDQLKVHWLTITGYNMVLNEQRTQLIAGQREICGTARTNLLPPNDKVDFRVRVQDNGESGSMDEFAIVLSKGVGLGVGGVVVLYLRASEPIGGGNIKLHKPNRADFIGGFGEFFQGDPGPGCVDLTPEE
jgi:hypothetical protein